MLGSVLIAEIRQHNDAHADKAEAQCHERPLEEMSVGPAVEERDQKQQANHERRNHHRRQRLEWTGKVLQQLKEAEEVPLGTRYVGGIRWVGDRIERGAEHDRK